MEKYSVSNVSSAKQTVTPSITDKTTLGELLKLLNLSSTSRKPCKAPTRKKLRNMAGDPIAVGYGCEVYKSGWAVYDNGFGRTVIWLPKCTDFTYQFGELKQYEKEYLKQNEKLDGGFLEEQSWVLAVTLIGDHRIESNSLNRTGSRKDSVDLTSKDNGDKNDVMEKVVADPLRRAFNWYDGHMGENPLDAVERRETRNEILVAMTDKQREVFIMYYRDGMTQDEIAAILGLSRRTIREHLTCALERAKKFF